MSEMRYTHDGERLPGSERERGRYGTFPSLAGESTSSAIPGMESAPQFPFVSWSVANGFHYPPEAKALLVGCGSAAEAYFLRAIAGRPPYRMDGSEATYGRWAVRVQWPVRKYRLDIGLLGQGFNLAIEIDGIGFHHRSVEQVAADYLRERRIVAQGFTVIRFTAQEAFSKPDECWDQIDHILASRKAA